MTEDIDIKKLTDDAFTAIDALFTDEDGDDIFAEEKEKEPDDFILIQEYMLAIEWECSDKNIKKFADFLNKLTPKYSGKHNQDILKMLLSIIKYLEKSKDKALPETHQVMEFIVKTFKHINQQDIDEASIKQEKNNAYNKVLDLKSKIAKVKAEYSHEESYKTTDTLLNQGQNLQPIAPNLSTTLGTSAYEPHKQQQLTAAESIESSKLIVSILTRLDVCENRLASIDAQNIKLQQQIYELTNLNKQLNDQIGSIELKFTDKVNKLSQNIHTTSLSKSSQKNSLNLESNFDQDSENPSFANMNDDSLKQYEEINFDGLDFDNMDSGVINQPYSYSKKQSLNELELNEVELDEIDIGLGESNIDNSLKSEEANSRLEIDFDKINTNSMEVSSVDSSIFEGVLVKNEEFENITTDDISYDEITEDLIQYSQDYKIPSKLDTSDDSHSFVKELSETESPEKLKANISDDNKEETNNNIVNDNKALKSGERINDAILEDIPEYVRCFKIENQTIALPYDKIYNVYKIPSKLTKSISQMPILTLGDFSSLFQNLSKNMKGHLKNVSNPTLKKMNVDIHLLTNQQVQYKIAILCSFEDKVSIIPVTNIHDNRNHPMSEIKTGRNEFSDYNVNIIDIGLIPFVTLSKK